MSESPFKNKFLSKIIIYIGSMFSGKSTALIRECSRFEAIGMEVLYINHIFDTRTGDYIQTHTQNKKVAIKFSTLSEVSDELFNKAQVIGIDEAQFFPDLYDFVIKCEAAGKTVVISGLDGDSDRKPFGQILQCIPLCDSVTKLTAMDMISKDGSDAIFSLRLKDVDEDGQVCVGAADKFVAVNRENYIREMNQRKNT
jgi:thymidine kinase